MPVVRSPGPAKKWCICHAILNEGERLLKHKIYIYIYIYIWKADKGVAEIKFCYPMSACEGKL